MDGGLKFYLCELVNIEMSASSDCQGGPDRTSVLEPVQPTLVVTAGSVFVTRRLAGPRYTGGVSGTAPPCSWEMTTSTGSPSHLRSPGNVFVRRKTAT